MRLIRIETDVCGKCEDPKPLNGAGIPFKHAGFLLKACPRHALEITPEQRATEAEIAEARTVTEGWEP